RIKKVRSNFSSQKLVVTVGLILAAFMAVIIIVQAAQYFRLKQAVTSCQAQLEQYEARNERVKEEIERLYDTEYIELLARKYLGLVKPGETFFQLND
ncbi:MAG TPA: septum formation initiator family protein, partial [Firmicutes bacterium]|nr:septum formation initiator family protein [Bacillota bacterium]